MAQRPFPPLTEDERRAWLLLAVALLFYLLLLGWAVRLGFWAMGWPWLGLW
jgi:hypothetical protein